MFIKPLLANRSRIEDSIVRILHMHIIQTWLTFNGPTFFVNPDIIQACEQTDVLDCVEGSDIKTVYPSGYFCLPDGMGYKSQRGDSIHHIWFRIIEKNEPVMISLCGNRHAPQSSQGNTPFLADARKLMLLGYWDKSGESSSFNLPIDTPGMSLLTAIEHYRQKVLLGTMDQSTDDIVREETKAYGLWACSLAINLCLLMQSYPRYIEGLPRSRSDRQHFKDQPLPQSLIITRSTKANLQQVVVDREDDLHASTGQKRELKRRRGHWRRQPHGDRFELENPQVGIIVLDDGRHAHMKWLEPWLNPKLFEAKVPDASFV